MNFRSLSRVSKTLCSALAFLILLLGVASCNKSSGEHDNSAPAEKAPPSKAYAVKFEHDVKATMRDGVVLVSDIYRPNADGKFPVLLTRTPYDKTRSTAFGLLAASRGYVMIAQDVRGRYASQGDWYPFKYEFQDGYDSVEWAAALPYSNGKIGMFGRSYVGATQFLAAIAHPPHLAGINPGVTPSNYHDGWTYQGGAFEQWFNETWTTELWPNTQLQQLMTGADSADWARILPLSAYSNHGVSSLASLTPYFADWLSHPNYDDYWKPWSIEDRYADIQVPVFSMGAWYDIFLQGTLRNFTRLKKEAGSDLARKNQRLLVNIAGHAGSATSQTIGAVDFGPKLPMNADEDTLRWYDFILKGVPNGADRDKPVRIFVMGRNDWRDADDWPPSEAKLTKYFLHSAGNANTSSGDGTLNTTSPETESFDHYVYDPKDPTPTFGGPLCCLPHPNGNGPQNQVKVEARKDVLVFTTPAFEKETEVTGPVTLDLYVSTSALDTDFTGKFVDVWPNGFAQNLTDGILRLRYRDSQEKPTLAKPGEIYHLTVDMAGTSNAFLPGHKLLLEISSSNFPRFNRNLNTGGDQSHETKMVSATNKVYHDREHPSALMLSLVP